MKKIILSVLILIAVLAFPLLSYASYIIHLKGGGQYITTKYWEEDDQIKFFVSGGTMGIDKDTVRKIEKSNLAPDEDDARNKPEKVSPQVDRAPENTIKGDALPAKSGAKEEKVDLKVYQDKMVQLKADLNAILTVIKKADLNKDQNAKDEAIAENRKISDEMWKLTDELKAKNNGKLPADWWEGIGSESK